MTRSCDSDTDCSARGEREVSQPVMVITQYCHRTPGRAFISLWHLSPQNTENCKSNHRKGMLSISLCKKWCAPKLIFHFLRSDQRVRAYSRSRKVGVTSSCFLWSCSTLYQVLNILVQINEVGIVVGLTVKIIDRRLSGA